MARRLGISRDDVLAAAVKLTQRGQRLTVAAVAHELDCKPPSIYHHLPGGLDELRDYATEKVLVGRYARVINDEGWTCTAHEPLMYGVCGGCMEGQTRLARRLLGLPR